MVLIIFLINWFPSFAGALDIKNEPVISLRELEKLEIRYDFKLKKLFQLGRQTFTEKSLHDVMDSSHREQLLNRVGLRAIEICREQGYTTADIDLIEADHHISQLLPCGAFSEKSKIFDVYLCYNSVIQCLPEKPVLPPRAPSIDSISVTGNTFSVPLGRNSQSCESTLSSEMNRLLSNGGLKETLLQNGKTQNSDQKQRSDALDDFFPQQLQILQTLKMQGQRLKLILGRTADFDHYDRDSNQLLPKDTGVTWVFSDSHQPREIQDKSGKIHIKLDFNDFADLKRIPDAFFEEIIFDFSVEQYMRDHFFSRFVELSRVLVKGGKLIMHISLIAPEEERKSFYPALSQHLFSSLIYHSPSDQYPIDNIHVKRNMLLLSYLEFIK